MDVSSFFYRKKELDMDKVKCDYDDYDSIAAQILDLLSRYNCCAVDMKVIFNIVEHSVRDDNFIVSEDCKRQLNCLK